MAPSDEAMAAAERFVWVQTFPNDVPHISVFEVTAPAWTDERAKAWRQSLIEDIATALDDHTADLRAKVEALRARVALLEGWNVGTEPPPPFVGSGSDDCEILIHASGFYRHPTESYEYNEWVKHGGDIVDVAFWRYTKKAQERLSDPETSLSELRQKPESEW